MYKADNKTQFEDDDTFFTVGGAGWIKIFSKSGVCVLNTLTLNYNQDIYPDVVMIGAQWGRDGIRPCNMYMDSFYHQRKVSLSHFFLTNHTWTYNIEGDRGMHQNVNLNAVDGKVYYSGNNTQV